MSESITLDNAVWYEMGHAKFWEQYLAEYTTYKLDYRKWYNIATMVLSVVGATTFPLWKLTPESETYVPGIIFGLMAIAQVLAVFQKNMVIDNDQLEGIIKLRGMYISYFNQLERLYIKVWEDKLSQEEVEASYYRLREMTLPIESLKDSLNIHPLKKVVEKGEERARNYLKPRFPSTNSEVDASEQASSQ